MTSRTQPLPLFRRNVTADAFDLRRSVRRAGRQAGELHHAVIGYIVSHVQHLIPFQAVDHRVFFQLVRFIGNAGVNVFDAQAVEAADHAFGSSPEMMATR